MPDIIELARSAGLTVVLDGRIGQQEYPIRPGKTCDQHLCTKHAHEVGADLHRCPEHVDAVAQSNLYEE